MPSEGKYIYCIIDSGEERDFGPEGIGGRGDSVYSVAFEDIAVAVSDSPVVEYSISRENIIAHMKVMEKIMNDYTILPVKFGTIAVENKNLSPSERINLDVLKARYKELKDLLIRMNNKVELSLKAIWINMETIFQEIVEENRDIRILKKRITVARPTQAYSLTIALGEIVKRALEAKKVQEEEEILKKLEDTYHEIRQNKILGDRMITNSAFLVEKNRIDEFDNLIEKLESIYDGRIKFKYVGPVPPCNFVDLVISLKGEEDGRSEI